MDAARRCANLDLPEKAYKVAGLERRVFEDYDCERGMVKNARLYARGVVNSGGSGQPLKHRSKSRENGVQKERKSVSKTQKQVQCERQSAPGPGADALSLEPPLQTGFERAEELSGVAQAEYARGSAPRSFGALEEDLGQNQAEI